MSYAADHLAWKQRVYKEQGIGRVNTYGSPLKENVKLPTHGIAELYAIEHSPSDPNLMGHYDVKRTLKTLIADPTKERLFSSPNRFIIDRYGRIIGNTTFQTTQKISFSPVTKNPKSLINFTNGVKSPSNKSNNKLFKSMSTMFQSPRKAKAKPFFEQAYMPKSHIDSMSQIESKIKHIQYSLTKLKPRNRESTGELPLLKKERFNEDVISEYSTKSKSKLVNSNINLINQPQKIAKQNNTELKRMLIDSVESMNDKEIEIIHSALQSAGDQNLINQYLENNTGELNQTNLKQLNQLNGEDCEDQYNEENELEEEIDDSVNQSELQDQVHPLENQKRIKSIKNSSIRSKTSTQYISQLESKIEEEKLIRVQMEKEIEDIKRMNMEIMNHIKSQKSKQEQSKLE